jgi:uncharacterized protein YkwD
MMETRLPWLLVALLVSALVQPAPADPARAMLDAVNAQRRAQGVAALGLDARLTRAACAHADDLHATGRLDHTGSDGSHVGDRVERAGYRWSYVAENLADTRASRPVDVVREWMQSPEHRKNLLNRSATAIGVAHVGNVWVLVLAR